MILEKEEQRGRVGLQVRKPWGSPLGYGAGRRPYLAQLFSGNPFTDGGQAGKVDRVYGEVDSGLSLCDWLEEYLSRFSI